MIKSLRVLGFYLLTMGVLQACLYCWMAFGHAPLSAFYLDPRTGIYFLESMVLGNEAQSTSLLRWVACAALTVCGLGLILRRSWLGIYWNIERALALPSVLFFALVIAANSSPAHGFSIGELLIPIPIFVVFTCVPLYSAYLLLKRGRDEAVATEERSTAD